MSKKFAQVKRINEKIQPRGAIDKNEKASVNKKELTNRELKREVEINFLKKFDLDPNYGPSVGVTRLERWEWAHKHNRDPPNQVKEMILMHLNDKDYVNGVWSAYKII